MPFLNKCCVENFKGISKSRFSVPKLSHKKWEKALGKVINKRSRVCGNHFKPQNIINTWVSGGGSSKYTVSIDIKYLTFIINIKI